MDFAEYMKIDAVSASGLKAMRKSAREYLHVTTQGRKATRAMGLGTGTHAAVFEPARFAAEYVVWGGDRRGKAYDAFCEAHPNEVILKRAEYELCCGMRDAVRSHPIAGPLLTPPGEAERAWFWKDDLTDLACKSRSDWWRVGLLADLKTSADIDERRFAATVYRLGYHIQAAHYRAGLVANGIEAPPFTIIAVESSPPHDVAVFEIDDDFLWAGEVERADLMARVAACRFSHQYPGRYPEVRPLSLPAWAMPETSGGLDGLDLEIPATEAA
jgi:PDDEXK-like domain of unknown function (DUF3799)